MEKFYKQQLRSLIEECHYNPNDEKDRYYLEVNINMCPTLDVLFILFKFDKMHVEKAILWDSVDGASIFYNWSI